MIGRILDAIMPRLRSLRYFMGDLFFVLARPFRAAGRRISPLWSSLPAVARRRIGAAVGAVVVVLLAVVVIVPNLPCSFPGGDSCAPSDEASALAPADAVVYLHANLDPEAEQYDRAVDVVGRTPQLSGEVLGRLLPLVLGPASATTDFGSDIQPWFGGELSVVLLPSAAGTEQVQMLEVQDEDGARAYADSITTGEPEPVEHEGVEVREDAGGMASALVDGFLVIGSGDGVRSIIDVATDAEGADALADDDVASEALAALPDDRLAEAYLSAEGIDNYLALSEGVLAPFEPFVDADASSGAALSLTAEEGGFRFATRSILDPERSEEAGGFFAAFAGFSPELPAELAPDTLAYVGLGQAEATVDSLLEQATVQAPGIARGFTDLIERLREAADVDIAADLLPALGGEAALAVVPRPPEEEAPLPGGEDEVPDALQTPDSPELIPGGQPSVPYVEFLAGEVDEVAAREALARLQGELAGSGGTGPGSAVFSEESFGEVTAQVLQRSAADVLAYAAFDSKLVIADDTAPVERLDADEDEGLAGSEAYAAATDGLPAEPALLGYLELSGLIAIAEQLGAGGETPFATFAPDLRRLQTFAVAVSTGEDQLSSDSLLRIARP